jgi:hypothetical protein
MASDVEICNNALSLLGDKPIVSLADDTVRARIASQFYGVTRDAVLRSHPWNCAIARAALPLLTELPVYGWAHKFQLPVDPYCLRVLACNDNEDRAYPGDTFKVEGRTLMTNSAAAKIRFIQRITDPNQYDTLLYEAFSARLAAKLAYPVTGSTSLSKSMWDLYVGFLKEARTVDGQEGSPDRYDVTTLLDVR